jgi:signal recognition particle subunit SRP72
LDPGDNDAIQTKLFLLLQTEQYNPALVLIDAGDNTARHAFEQAYSHYRLQHEAEAEDILRAIKEEKGDEDRGLLHLEAQLVCVFEFCSN